VVVLLTDALDDLPALIRGLGHFTQRRHDVVLFHLLDPAELSFPFQGATEFLGLEQLPSARFDATAVRQAYLAELEKYLRELTAACHALGVEYRRTLTNVPAENTLAAWLSQRMARGGS
jgi:uncharacterized protein (DUF58 family)